MALRTAHGNAAKHGALLVVETLPADELPRGVQATTQVESTTERQADGRFRKGTRTAQSQGGKARKGKTRLASKLGLTKLTSDAAFAPYLKAAEDFKRAQVASLARTVGGGYCGPAPSSIVATAALQLAASRHFFDLAAESGDADLAVKASRLGDASRSSLLTAHELCAREALARPQESPRDRILRLAAEARSPQ